MKNPDKKKLDKTVSEFTNAVAALELRIDDRLNDIHEYQETISNSQREAKTATISARRASHDLADIIADIKKMITNLEQDLSSR